METVREIGAREAHSLKIRSALIQACGDLLAKMPIDAITIANIVETAGVAKGSFYNHFPDKETLAMAVSTAIRDEIEQKVRQSNLNVTDPAYKIARGVCNHVKLAVEDPRRAIIMMRSRELGTTSNDSPMNRQIRAHVLEGVQSSRFSARCEQAGILLLMGVTFFTMARIIEDELSRDESIELTRQAVTLALCGFGVLEEEAARIASDSASDVIGNK
ncbi:MAG: TetR/AcrR family transcriptional regulator [Halieaceae bacterium]|jgi:AcrR family transcriptional regulator|nr:TetR/AcrR family transcriptional regulator [Halieaceae bacterium]